MLYAFRHQPFKGLYLTYQLFTTVFIRLPVWIIVSFPRSRRPRESWTLKRTIFVKFLRHFFQVGDVTGPILRTPNHLALAPGAETRGVWVSEVNHLVTGKLKIWAASSQVQSIRLPGYWTHKTGSSIDLGAPPQPGEKVIYQLHGGAYVRLSANPNDPTANISKGYVKHVTGVQRVFSIEYRLASAAPFADEHPFPTQLIDALAGYNYLIDVVGFAPADIILSGDSAGGNLAHALTRYLIDHSGSELGLPAAPGALILLSPWMDIGSTTELDPASTALKRNSKSDYLRKDESTAWTKRAFLGPHGLEAADTNEYISPASRHPSLSVTFVDFPRTFIVAGGGELIYDSINTVKDRMIRDLGEGDGVSPGDGKIRYYEAPDGIHDYLIFTWHEPERTDTYKAINKWIHAA